VELIVENIMDPLEPAEIVSLVSVFVGHGRSKNEPEIENMDIPETLRTAVMQVKEIFTKIKGMETEAGIDTEFEPNFLIIKPLYEWAIGRNFIEICEYTEVLEGAIVRSIQRVEQTLKSIQRGLTQVGNSTLVEKVKKGAEIIKRGIAFSASLYLEQNNELM
jgi:antiviral helicase SKI2